jgi:hypothetical protein
MINGNFYKKGNTICHKRMLFFYMVYANGFWNLWHLMFVISRKQLSLSLDIYIHTHARARARVCVCVCEEHCMLRENWKMRNRRSVHGPELRMSKYMNSVF